MYEEDRPDVSRVTPLLAVSCTNTGPERRLDVPKSHDDGHVTVEGVSRVPEAPVSVFYRNDGARLFIGVLVNGF